MSKLYSVSVYWGPHFPTEPVAAYLESAFLPGDDWIRFSSGQWFLASGRPSHEIAATLRARVLGYPGAQCVVAAVEPVAANGAAPEWVWSWLNEKMTKQLSLQFRGGH